MSHYDAQPIIDIYGSVEGTDLASVAGRSRRSERQQSKTSARDRDYLRGQIETMQSSFQGLAFGLLFAIVLVYALIVVNFQSWLDPFIIIAALPGALAGIVWLLFVTGPLQRPRAHGRHHVHGRGDGELDPGGQLCQGADGAGHERCEAALTAGFTRFRPVIMTALAMIIGMVPMALGLGDGGEQNAPLGRAVIGGLLLATFGTLTFVPVFFSLMHRNDPPVAETGLWTRMRPRHEPPQAKRPTESAPMQRTETQL